MSSKYDAIVIGAGQAGPSLADRLGREGLKTAIIERQMRRFKSPHQAQRFLSLHAGVHNLFSYGVFARSSITLDRPMTTLVKWSKFT